jgi:hypothetical protein
VIGDTPERTSWLLVGLSVFECMAGGYTPPATTSRSDAGDLLRLRLSPVMAVLDLKEPLRCRACRGKGRAVVSVKWRGHSQ